MLVFLSISLYFLPLSVGKPPCSFSGDQINNALYDRNVSRVQRVTDPTDDW